MVLHRRSRGERQPKRTDQGNGKMDSHDSILARTTQKCNVSPRFPL